MQLAALKRWHWVVLSLIVGFILAMVHQGLSGDLHGDLVEGFGYLIADQDRFENALVQEFQDPGRNASHRIFEDLRVYPQWTDDLHGGTKLVYVVAGSFWMQQDEKVNGQVVPALHRYDACFISQAPYTSCGDPSIYNGKGTPDYGKQFRAAGPTPTVLDYLKVMHAAAGVDYSYAWWDLHPTITFVLGSLIVIGGIWPTVINLIAFGTLARPPEAKAMSLWGVRAHGDIKREPVPVHVAPSVDALDGELEAALHGQPAAVDDGTPQPATRALAAGPLESLASGPAESDKAFGADKEDFYPTERRGRNP
jgi:hypothetical protein